MAVDPALAKVLFETASALTDPMARASLLDRECSGDAELRAMVQALLRVDVAAFELESDPDATNEPDAGASANPPPAGTLDEDGPATDADDGRGERAGIVIAGRYTLIEPIGEGGMGSVWRAQQTEPVKRFVAVKLIKTGLDSRRTMARFEAERQALALMDHPNIAKVFDGGLHDGRPYFVMELVQGTPITRYCDQRRLSPRKRLELFVSVCQAIQHAHQKGIIHRDVKPSNVLVALYDEQPVIKVIDFGVAKAIGGELTEKTIDTGIGSLVGTLEYMSPEQASLNTVDVDTRSDVYSLGVLLYELLAGAPPFTWRELEHKGLMEVLRVVREVDPPRPSARLSTADALPSISATRGVEPRRLTAMLRHELDWVVMKALEKDRSRRYETASGFAADVMRHLSGEPVRAHPPSIVYRGRKFLRRHERLAITASMVFLALLVGIAGTTWGLVEAKRQGQLALAAAASEKTANERAQKRLAQVERGNELLDSIFQDLNIHAERQGPEPLEAVLAHRLLEAAEQLEGESIGDPLAVALLQNRMGLALNGLGYPAEAAGLLVKARETLTALKGGDAPDTLRSMSGLAAAYLESGKPDLALPLMEETLKLMKANLGVDHNDTLMCMINLGTAYLRAGKTSLALPYYEETLKRRRATLGNDHPGTHASMGDLAMAYLHAGKPELAVPLLEQTLKFWNAMPEGGPPTLPTIMNDLALAYLNTGKPELALPVFEEVLKLRKARLGVDHPDTLMSMNELGSAYVKTGKPELAAPLLEEAVELGKAKAGVDHPITLESMNNLAAAYLESGNPHLAAPLFEETLKLRKAKGELDHPETLTCMNNLALAYLNTGKPELALPLFEETLKLQKPKMGADHPKTLRCMNNLAWTYLNVGKTDLAIPLLEETLKLRKAKLGVEHLDTLTSMTHLAHAYFTAKRLDSAIPLFEETLKLKKSKIGADHPDTLRCMTNLTVAYATAGRAGEAVALLKDLRAVARDELPPETPTLAEVLAVAGLRLLQNGAYDEAEPVCRECLSIRERDQPDNWSTFNMMSMLGGARLGLKKYADAEPLLLKGYEGMLAREKIIPPQGKPRVPEALDRLIELYNAIDKPDEAAKYQALRAHYPTPPKREQSRVSSHDPGSDRPPR